MEDEIYEENEEEDSEDLESSIGLGEKSPKHIMFLREAIFAIVASETKDKVTKIASKRLDKDSQCFDRNRR